MKLKKIEIGINDGVYFGNEKRHHNHNRDKQENKSNIIWIDRVHSEMDSSANAKVSGKSFEQMLLDEFKGTEVNSFFSTSNEGEKNSRASNAQKAVSFLNEYWA